MVRKGRTKTRKGRSKCKRGVAMGRSSLLPLGTSGAKGTPSNRTTSLGSETSMPLPEPTPGAGFPPLSLSSCCGD
ncbi:hypothetical protein CLOP_g3211 [Closterium sp. NIES-67]|nr:hypothetical protein CLOP_g3211 [Closterium sp. NIES-67]